MVEHCDVRDEEWDGSAGEKKEDVDEGVIKGLSIIYSLLASVRADKSSEGREISR